MIYFVLFFVFNFVTSHQNGDQEDWSGKFDQPYYYVQSETQLPHQITHQSQISIGCPVSSQCIPLSSCPVLVNILNHACIKTDRSGSLGCGYPGSGLVCCPRSCGQTTNGWFQPSYPSATAAGIGDKADNEHKCGSSVVQGENYRGIGAQPWVVRVGFRNTISGEIKYPCAGTILNPRVILTAGHCALAKADNYKLYSIRAGEWRTDSTLDCGDTFCALPLQDIAISHVIVHPGYEQKTFKNDVALIVLRADINYTVTAQPICTVEPWSQTSTEAILVGWGKIAGQKAALPFQQTIELPVVNTAQCIAVYGRTIPITDDHLCAGGQYGKDACEGFGGAPLIVKHNDVHYQIGIMSFGSNQCGAAGVPSVYTNIKKYTQWIKDNTPIVYS